MPRNSTRCASERFFQYQAAPSILLPEKAANTRVCRWLVEVSDSAMSGSMTTPPHPTAPSSPRPSYSSRAEIRVVPFSVPGRVQMTLGSGWPGTVCSSTFPLAHPAFSNIVCSTRARWPGSCGACCRRCWTTVLSSRRKVTLSARQALESAKTTSRLDHRSMRYPSRRLEVSTSRTTPEARAMDSAITRGHRYSAQNKKTRLATGLLIIDSQQIANRRLAARANVAVLLCSARRRIDARVVGNPSQYRVGNRRGNPSHLAHAAALVGGRGQLIAKASRRYAGSVHTSPKTRGYRGAGNDCADGEDLFARQSATREYGSSLGSRHWRRSRRRLGGARTRRTSSQFGGRAGFGNHQRDHRT